MDRGKKQRRKRRRARPYLPLLALSVLIVAMFFTAAAGSKRPAEQLPQDEATPAPQITQSAAATPSPTPAPTPTPYIPDEAEVEMLARVLWGEARGVPSDMEKAAVVWCVLNRVDAAGWPDTVAGVITQKHQFAGYSPDYPATEELKEIAADVLTRWAREKAGESGTGRVLPAEYVFFTGDGERNYFRKEFDSEAYWDWSLQNPYNS